VSNALVIAAMRDCRVSRQEVQAGRCVLALWLGLGGWAWGAPTGDLSRATRRLGSAEFAERHEAGDELLKAGAMAIPYLRDASESDSPEVRFRALELLRRIELQQLEDQKGAILEGRVTAGHFEAWDRFRDLAGNDEPARRMFVAMLERSPDLLLSMGTRDFPVQFERRLTEHMATASPWGTRRSEAQGSEDLASLLFAGCQPEAVLSPAHVQSLSRAAQYPWFATQVTAGQRSDVLQAIVKCWIAQPGRPSPESRLQLALSLRMREGLSPAREILVQEGAALELQSAILFMAIFGEDADIPRLERLLKNETELQNFQSRKSAQAVRTQVRDLALVALWKIKGEKPADHGVKEYAEQNGSPRPGTIGFQDDEERRLAIAAWRAWRVRNVKAELPPDGWAMEGRRG
jgi:hypothetical protein